MQLFHFLCLAILPFATASRFINEFRVYASGAQEVPPVESEASAELILQFANDLSSFNYELRMFDIMGVTQAHLHCNTAGFNGPVATFLLPFQEPEDFSGFVVQDILDNDDLLNANFEAACGVPINNVASLYEAVLQRKVYLNIHTATNPAGELRGQIVE